MVQKKVPAAPLTYIHSKPVVYTNNGGGRDTYISGNDGGFRPLHRAAPGKTSFYASLRSYDPAGTPFKARKKSHTATYSEKKDDFSASQDHFNPKYRKEMSLVHNYQHMLDHRLSKPKTISQVEESQRTSQTRIRVYKNSSPNEQLAHQEAFYGKAAQPARSKQMLASQDSFDRLNGSRTFSQNYACYPNEI